MKRLAVTSLTMWVTTTSGSLADVKLVNSVVDGLMALKPPSQVITEACDTGISGRVSISGSSRVAGTVLTHRSSRARDLVTMTEVDFA